MKCAYCGKKNKPGALVCKRCGIALPVPPPPEPIGADGTRANVTSVTVGEEAPPSEKAKGLTGIKDKLSSAKAKKPALIGVAAVLLAAAALALLILCLSGNNGITLPKKNGYTVMGSPAGIFYQGENASPEGFEANIVRSSIDGRSAALTTGNGTLFSLSKGESQAVAKDIADLRVSVDGSRLIYRDASELLWSYEINGSQKAPVCICNEAVAPGFTISPDGKTVLFMKRSDSKLCLLSGGKIREVGDKLYPVSVSNGGKHIYAYSDAENALYYVTKKGRSSYIRSNIIGDVFLNNAHDEIVFSIRSGDDIVITMLSRAGSEPLEILNSSEPVAPVLPVSALTVRDELLTHHTVTCPFKSFEGKLFSGGALIRYSAKGSTVLEPNSVENAIASDDYRTVLYMTDGGLAKRTVGSDAAADRIAESCSYFECSTNCNTVWYVGGDGSLHYLKGSRDTLIAPNIYLPADPDGDITKTLAITPDGKSAAFISNGTLCTNKGGNPKQTFAYPGTNCDCFACSRYGVFIFSADGWKKLDTQGEKTDLTK